ARRAAHDARRSPARRGARLAYTAPLQVDATQTTVVGRPRRGGSRWRMCPRTLRRDQGCRHARARSARSTPSLRHVTCRGPWSVLDCRWSAAIDHGQPHKREDTMSSDTPSGGSGAGSSQTSRAVAAHGQKSGRRVSYVDTAVVFVDPQNDVLSEKGTAWA